MSKRVRPKKMPLEEFRKVLELEWRPVKLVGNAVPRFLDNLPNGSLVYASGALYPGLTYTGQPGTSGGKLVGGLDVYREAPEDAKPLNKDWYPVIKMPGTDGQLLVIGPANDRNDHWMDDIPARLIGAEVLGVPAPNIPSPGDSVKIPSNYVPLPEAGLA